MFVVRIHEGVHSRQSNMRAKIKKYMKIQECSGKALGPIVIRRYAYIPYIKRGRKQKFIFKGSHYRCTRYFLV